MTSSGHMVGGTAAAAAAMAAANGAAGAAAAAAAAGGVDPELPTRLFNTVNAAVKRVNALPLSEVPPPPGGAHHAGHGLIRCATARSARVDGAQAERGDYEFYRAGYPAFRKRTKAVGDRLLNLTNALMKHQTRRGAAPKFDDLDEAVEQFEDAVELIDHMLETAVRAACSRLRSENGAAGANATRPPTQPRGCVVGVSRMPRWTPCSAAGRL